MTLGPPDPPVALKVFCVVYLQANRDFQRTITPARKNIFSCGFSYLVDLNKIFQNKLIRVLDLPDPPGALTEVQQQHYVIICKKVRKYLTGEL